MLSSQTPLRVSCAGLVKIELDGYLLATFNRQRLRQGVYVYTPPGGSYHYQGRATRSYLKETLGLRFQHGKDLRVLLPEDPNQRARSLEQFAAWFLSRQGRETSPSRELYEELVCEDKVLCLNKHTFPSLTLFSSDSLARIREPSDRDDSEGMLTEYFFELFQAQLTTHSRAHLRKSLRENHPRVKLISLPEIIKGEIDSPVLIKGV